jgi:hypothetical protein
VREGDQQDLCSCKLRHAESKLERSFFLLRRARTTTETPQEIILDEFPEELIATNHPTKTARKHFWLPA